MKKLGIISSSIIILSVLLPWVMTNTESSGVFNSSVSGGSVSGYMTSWGFIGIVLGIASIFLFLKENKWSFIPGIGVILNGILFIIQMSSLGGKSSSSIGNYSQRVDLSVDPQFGVYLFIIGGILSVIFGLNLLNPKIFNLSKLGSKKISGKTSSNLMFEILPYILILILFILILLDDLTKIGGDLKRPIEIFNYLTIFSCLYALILNFKTTRKSYIKILITILLLIFIFLNIFNIYDLSHFVFYETLFQKMVNLFK